MLMISCCAAKNLQFSCVEWMSFAWIVMMQVLSNWIEYQSLPPCDMICLCVATKFGKSIPVDVPALL